MVIKENIKLIEARKPKPFFGKSEGNSFAVNIISIDNEFPTKSFGQRLGDMKKVGVWKKTAKTAHVGSKGKATLPSVRRWVKENKPVEFYAVWKSDSNSYKDDSIEIYYKDSIDENKLKTFGEHSQQQLDEVAIQFGGKAYPKFGQVVILAGGAGSGKGFVLSNLLSIEGKTFDVDEMKRLAIASSVFSSKVKAETGVDLKKLNLRVPENVSKIHEIIGGLYKVDKKIMSTVNQSVLSAHPERRPNLIFDVTLKDTAKLEKITRSIQQIGYDKKDIHIVWVMNKFDVAVKQNAGRARVVPEEIL